MAKVLFAAYLHSIEGTEREAEFFDNLAGLKEGLSQAPANVPIVGGMVNSLRALCNCSSVAEFMDTEEYETLAGWYITIDEENGGFSLSPGPEVRKKIFKVLAIIGGVLLALWLFKRRRK